MRQFLKLAGLCATAACTPPAADGNTNVPTVPTATVGGGSAARWNAEDACALLGKSAVGAALGTEVTEAKLETVSLRTDDRAGFSTCFYTLKDGQQAAFLARQSPVADNTPEAFAKMRSEVTELMGPIEDVTGVGVNAFWVPRLRQLNVFIGQDRYYNLTMPAKLGAKDPKSIALGLASRIR